MSEEYLRYNNEEIMHNNLCGNRGFNSSNSNKTLDTLTILTDIKQLENKLVILIDVNPYNNDLVLYYTEDHCLLVQINQIMTCRSLGGYVDAKYLTTIEEIYDYYECELADFGILSVEEVNGLADKARKEYELRMKDQNKQKRYKEYLKLKEEFEMEDYK